MRSRTHLSTTLVALLVLLLALAAPALAQSDEQVQPDRPAPWNVDEAGSPEVVPDLWFVEFAERPEAAGGSRARHANERARFNRETAAEQIRFEQRENFSTLWNGLTVRASTGEIAAIRALDSVTAVYPVAVIEAPERNEVAPELATALSMTGADAAQSELGFTGDGLHVAVIDTGVDYNHPDLGGTGEQDTRLEADPTTRQLDHPRITHGWDYVGEEFDASNPDGPAPAPDPDPFDLHGHGTHVSGIVGANAASEDGVTGVAPGVTFGAYKVFALGSTTSEIIVAALEDAYEDGADVINMSLGATFAWGQEYPTTQASNELAARGVVVVNSAGNDGGLGAWTLSAPANGHDIISVASADNTFFEASVFEVAQLADPIPWSEMAGAENPPAEGTSEEVAWVGRACTDSMGDQLLDDPTGRVALVVRGDCTFAEKYLAAANAGATGVVIYNNVSGQFAGTISDAGIEGIWSVGINNADGSALQQLIESGEAVTLGFSDETLTLPNPTGGLVSSFSSYGQDIELEFGPSITAPGGLINSTWPLADGGEATISGTSMSAPHVSGAVALLLEDEPNLDPAAIRDRLQNVADPTPWSLAPSLGFLDHAFRQGAGMLQIDEAILADQHAVPGQLSLGDADEVTTTLALSNDATEDVTYTVGHSGGLDIGISTFAPFFFLPSAGVTTVDEVSVPAGGTADVEVTITADPASLPNQQYGGYITFTPTEGDASELQVPYTGYAGDYVGEMALFGHWDVIDGELVFVDAEPRLSRIKKDQLLPVKQNQTFNPHRGDFPVIEAFFGHFPREMVVLAHHESGETFTVITDEYLPRSAAPDEYYAIPWTGRTVDDEAVPRGVYTLELQVLRALGDADDPDHWDTWESPEFRLEGSPDRPAVP